MSKRYSGEDVAFVIGLLNSKGYVVKDPNGWLVGIDEIIDAVLGPTEGTDKIASIEQAFVEGGQLWSDNERHPSRQR